MNPELSHVRVTVIDFMGVFLPGTVWLFLLCVLDGIIGGRSSSDPVQSVQSILSAAAASLGASFYVIVLVATLIVGYVVKALSIKPSEIISTLFDTSWAWLRRQTDGKPSSAASESDLRASDYRFPYDVRHRDKEYYRVIEGLVLARAGVGRAGIPSSQFFNTCKRLLKLHAPSLWEEAEYREAEVRMLSSLFLASLFNIVLVAIRSVTTLRLDLDWLVWAVAGSVALWLAFRVRRRREVESVYFATLAALYLIPLPEKSAQAGVETSVQEGRAA